jgi:hypothetical protein
MEFKSIKMIKGYHLTQTEKKALLFMLNNGLTSASNKPRTKQYVITEGTKREKGYEHGVKISTRERSTIGADVDTSVSYFIIEAN